MIRQTTINMGYYIIEDVEKPSYISFSCERLISASECICNIQPDLRGCFWKGCKEEKKAYKLRLGLSDEKYAEMSEYVAKLFDRQILEVNGRFNSLDVAFKFRREYLGKCENLHTIGLSTTDKYINVILEEFGDSEYFKRVVPPEKSDLGKAAIEKHFIGCEIIGYDMGIGSPHSYLCNSLDRELAEYGLKTGKWGLIQNDFEKVEEFARNIQGKGEPVDWIPVMLCEYERLGMTD